MRESHCSHCPPCKADEKTSPWAAFSTRTGPGQWSGGQTSTWCGAGAEKWKKLGRVWGSLFCHFFFFDLLFFLIIFWPDALPVRVSGQIYKFHSSGPLPFLTLPHLFLFFFFKYRLWIISSEQLHGQQHCGVKENLLSSYTPDQTLRWGTASAWIICHCEHPLPTDFATDGVSLEVLHAVLLLLLRWWRWQWRWRWEAAFITVRRHWTGQKQNSSSLH